MNVPLIEPAGTYSDYVNHAAYVIITPYGRRYLVNYVLWDDMLKKAKQISSLCLGTKEPEHKCPDCGEF